MKSLDEIKDRYEAVAGEPWEASACNMLGGWVVCGGEGVGVVAEILGENEARFIEASHRYVPRLVRALEHAMGSLSACRSRLGDPPMMTLFDEGEVAAILAEEDE